MWVVTSPLLKILPLHDIIRSVEFEHVFGRGIATIAGAIMLFESGLT
jgi:hypothetical protein